MKDNLLIVIILLVLAHLITMGVIPKSSADEIEKATVNFTLSDTDYKFDIPEGYCMPTGTDIEAADKIASLDKRNMTHFTLVLCTKLGEKSDLTRWGVLKTPKSSIGKRIPTRQSFIKDFKKLIKKNDLADKLNREKTLTDVFGQDIKIKSRMEFFETDEYAAYLVGAGSTSTGDQKVPLAFAGAMTIVKKQVFSYYKYALKSGPKDIMDLLKQVRKEIRLFVIGNPD